MDRVREALFSILGQEAMRGRVLDLYAGVGTLGIEALSRGASAATFVEQNRAVAAVLKENLHRLSEQEAQIVVAPVAKALSRLGREGRRYDLVFLDPPYRQGLVSTTLGLLATAGLVAEGGRVVAEHEVRLETPVEAGPLLRYDRRTYGDTGLSFYSLLGGEVR